MYKTLIIAPPGRIRDGLELLLSSYPHIHLLPPASDEILAWQDINEYNPELIILDYDLPDPGIRNGDQKTEIFIQHCKKAWPSLPCITLVDSPRQIRSVIEAGADATLLKGFTIAQLLERIDYVLLQQTNPDLKQSRYESYQAVDP